MKKNVVPLVVIALVVAVLSTGIFYGLIVGRMEGSSSSVAKLRFVSVGNLEKGQVLKAENFQLVSGADPGVAVPARAEDLVGRRLLEKVEAGTVLTESVLSPLSELGLRSGVPEGMRAVTLHISDSSSVIQLIHPGDRVDVQALISRQRNGEMDVELRTLLQNATVYNVFGENNPQLQGRMVMTILSSPQDAERLSVADAGARLRVVLRNRKDQEIVPLRSTSLLNLGEAEKPIVRSSFLPGPSLPKPAKAAVDVQAVELEVSLVEVSKAQMAELVPGVGADTLSISSLPAHANLMAKLEDMGAPVLARSRLATGKSGEFSWKTSDQASMGVKIEQHENPLDGSKRLRIQPETIKPDTPGAIVRRLESSISVSRNQGAVVGGLVAADQVNFLRENLSPGASPGGGEVLMIISPVGKK
jgi:Flp pilus assembly protein CpaB